MRKDIFHYPRAISHFPFVTASRGRNGTWLMANGKWLMLLCVALISASPAHSQAVIRSFSGDAWVESGVVRRPPRAGMMVQAGERVATGRDGRVEVLLADASRITVGASSAMKIERSRASTTAVSLVRGEVRVYTSPYRWKSEGFHVTTPVVTMGVRGTIFDVNVAASGEAFVSVETGAVIAHDLAIEAGASAEIAVDGTPRRVEEPDRRGALLRWLAARRELVDRDRKRVAEAIGSLLKQALERRGRAARTALEGVKEAFDELRDRGEEMARTAPERVARALVAMQRGLERTRDILESDREAVLREEILRRVIAEGRLPPWTVLTANGALNAADRDRRKREEDLRKIDDAIEKVGGGIAFLAQIAASDPTAGRSAARIITEGLGLPLEAEALPSGAVVIERGELGWENGARWTMIRTMRGREDFRVEVGASVEPDSVGLRIRRDPFAFDTPVELHGYLTETAVYLDAFENVKQVNARHPALYYRFPIREGDTWIAWTPPGLLALFGRIERHVTATERVRTPAGEFDCLRIETRVRKPRDIKMPLIHVEWVAKGIGPVREVSFRSELKSVMWDERIADF